MNSFIKFVVAGAFCLAGHAFAQTAPASTEIGAPTAVNDTGAIANKTVQKWLEKDKFTLSYEVKGLGEAIYTVRPKKSEVVFGLFASSGCSRRTLPAVISVEESAITVFIKRSLPGCGDLKFTVEPSAMVAFSQTLNSQSGAEITSGALKVSPD